MFGVERCQRQGVRRRAVSLVRQLTLKFRGAQANAACRSCKIPADAVIVVTTFTAIESKAMKHMVRRSHPPGGAATEPRSYSAASQTSAIQRLYSLRHDAGSPRADSERGDIGSSPRVAAQRTRMNACFGPATRQRGAAVSSRAPASMLQRKIWHFTENQWKVAEYGTAGGFTKPLNPLDGSFFNDVNNKTGNTLDEVRAGLLDRTMQVGSVTELSEEGAWTALAVKLEDECKAKIPDAKGDTVEKTKDIMLDLGVIRLQRGVDGKVVGAAAVPGKEQKHSADIASFIVSFMRKNGQLGYIERQPWFKDNLRDVNLDLNFYFNRPMSDSGELGMHKDTAGDNLFVNIIFSNTEETPATEWTQDRDLPKGVKEELSRRLMPTEMFDAINAAKLALGTDAIRIGGKDTIEGDTMPRLAYVSWVDELIWHSTPSLNNRPKWNMAQYMKDNWKKTDDSRIYEVALMLVEKDSSRLHRTWLRYREKFGNVFSKRAWTVFQGTMMKDTGAWLLKDLFADLDAFDWGAHKFSGRTAEEVDLDFRKLTKAKSAVPTGVTGRLRANSDAAMLQKIIAASKKQPKRSFLRTWVRVVEKNAQ